MRTVLAVGSGDLLGETLRDRAVTSTDRDALQRILRADEPLRVEVRLNRDDGREVVLALVGSRLGAEKNAGTICVCRDVSEERGIERRVAAAAARDASSLGASLHEELAQELSGISLLMSGITRAVKSDTSKDDLGIVNRYIENAIRTARRLAQRISPTAPVRGSLGEALEALAKSSSEELGVIVRYEGVTAGVDVNGQIGDQLYRLVSDAITFGAGELRASSIYVSIRDRVDLRLEIGFSWPLESDVSELALRRLADLITYRARLIGGSCIQAGERESRWLWVTFPNHLRETELRSSTADLE
jgi:hypothetical protein